MKITLVIIVLVGVVLFIASCSNKSKKEESKTIMIDPNELTPGPIQHQDLSEAQLGQIKSIHKTFEEVYPITLDETITNFKRDLNIDKEINLWMKMKETFISVMEQKKYVKVEERKEVFKLILMRTMMSNNEVKEKVELQELDNESVISILTLFESKMAE